MKTMLEEFIFDLETRYFFADSEEAMRGLEQMVGEYIAGEVEDRGDVTLSEIKLKGQILSLLDDNSVLKTVIINTLPMAVRYAHGRSTYAPHNVRTAYAELIARFPNDLSLRLKRDDSLKRIDSLCTVRGDNLDDLWLEGVEK